MPSSKKQKPQFRKVPSGIAGLDDITGGGLPEARTTLVCGGPGCGKTVVGMQFLVKGAIEHGEPGVFVSFEESAEELAQNFSSFGYDLPKLEDQNKIIVDYIHVERSEIEETGEYDLEALFIRLSYAIESIGAKRIVLDSLEALFLAFSDEFILRSELRRLFGWLKTKGLTAVITAERGEGALTRQGLEEYVSDCVILLAHRTTEDVSTRRLRIIKYRGSTHGTNDYPFLIDETGVSVLPITSMRLNYVASRERISSGIPRLDSLLGGGGYFKGSSILISGTAGTGKSSIAAHFANATCANGDRCLYFASEESPSQIILNMRSIGLDLQQWVDAGLLYFYAARPMLYGLETHLANIHKQVSSFKPKVVIVDPITNFTSIGTLSEVKGMLMRLVDLLKAQQTTIMFTSLVMGGDNIEQSEVGISSIIETWLLLRDLELNGERNRVMYILKSRGMAHSNQVREFLLTSHGIELIDVYLGPGGVLTGSARLQQEAQEAIAAQARQEEITRRQRDLQWKRQTLDAQIASMRAEYDAEVEEVNRLISQVETQERSQQEVRQALAQLRRADTEKPQSKKNNKGGRQ